MIGKQQVTIDARQFLQGLATSDYMPDGGIGTSSYNVNPIATPGVIRATPVTTPTGTLTDNIIASCEDPQAGTDSDYHRIFVCDDGKIFSATDTSFTSRVTPADTSGYTAGVTDMAVFNGKAYITRNGDVGQLTVSGTTFTYDDDWWTATKSESPLTSGATVHPMVVFESLLWIADDNVLHNVDTSENTTPDVLVLNTSERVTALGIDPGTGLMMIGIQTINNTDTDYTAKNYIALFDGYSAKVRRKVPVDGHVTAFHAVNGTMYVAMDNMIGAWNGAGVSFLRRMLNSSSNNPIYNRFISHFENTLLVVDGANVLAYGDIANGKKAWYPIYRNQVNANNLEFMGSFGHLEGSGTPLQPLIAVNEGTNLRYMRPMDTTNVGSGVFIMPNINFERPVNVRGIDVFTTGITTTAGIGGVGIIDEEETTTTPTVSTFVVASGTRRKFHFDFNKKLSTLQGKFTLDTQAFGFIRAVIYYDVVE